MLDQQQGAGELPGTVQATGWTVGRRLMVGFASVGLFLLVATSVIFVVLQIAIGAFEKVSSDVLLEQKALADIRALSIELLSETREYLLTRTDATLDELYETSEALNQAVESYASIGAEVEEEEESAIEQQLVAQMQQAVLDLQTAMTAVIDLVNVEIGSEEVEEAIDGLEIAEGNLEVVIDEVEIALDAETEQYVATVEAAVDSWLPWAIGGLAILLFAWLVIVIFLLRRSIVGPMQALTESAQRMAAGDLTQKASVSSDDEIGILAQVLNDMAARLQGLIEDLRGRAQDLERRALYLEATSTIARDVGSELDLPRILAQAVTLISDRLGFYHVAIFFVDAGGEEAVLQAASSEGGQRALARGHRLKIGQGIVGTAVAQNQARMAADVGADAVYFDNPDLSDTRSEAALPLRARGEIIGVLDVQSVELNAFREEDVAVLRTLADQLAVALSNARLLRQVEDSLEAERRAYGEFGREAWQALLRGRRDLGFVRDRQGLVPVGNVGNSQAEAAAAEDGRTLAVPLRVRDQIIGIVDITKPDGAGDWTPTERTLATDLGEQLIIALESARLYQDTQRRAAQEQLLGQVSTRMRETLDVDTVLRTALQEMKQALGLSKMTVRLVGQPDRPDTSDKESVR